jgi:heavy metal efflux system protein
MLLRIAYAFFTIGYLCVAYAQTVEIKFDQIKGMVIQNSPEMKILEAGQKMVVAESKAELQWSNPEIEIGKESISNKTGSEDEFIAAIGKTITMPWVGSLHKGMWRDKIAASGSLQKAQFFELLAETKSLYVEIVLLDKKRERLSEFQAILKQASQISLDRFNEGTISGLQNGMMQISLFNLNSELLKIEREVFSLKSDFKIALGIGPTQNIYLKNPVGYLPFNFESIANTADLNVNPAILAFNYLIHSSQKQGRMEKASVLPEISISGGYKKVNSDLDGYVMGVSFPLPVLNKNKAKMQQRQIETNILKIKAERFRSELIVEIQNKLTSLKGYAGLLSNSQNDIQNTNEIIENLVFSFQEGWINLGDVIDGMQIYSESLDSYYENLKDYYLTAFQLEALMGKELVFF